MKITTGTVSITAGSNVVTGTGTTWLADGAKAGMLIMIEAVAFQPQIAAVISDTQLKLAELIPGLESGRTYSGLEYVISSDFTGYAQFPYPAYGDEDSATILKRAIEVIDNIGPT